MKFDDLSLPVLEAVTSDCPNMNVTVGGKDLSDTMIVSGCARADGCLCKKAATQALALAAVAVSKLHFPEGLGHQLEGGIGHASAYEGFVDARVFVIAALSAMAGDETERKLMIHRYGEKGGQIAAHVLDFDDTDMPEIEPYAHRTWACTGHCGFKSVFDVNVSKQMEAGSMGRGCPNCGFPTELELVDRECC